MTNKIKINVPEGMEIDKENSTFECIKFKPKWVPKKGDIAAVGDDHFQIILVNKYIGQSSIGFYVDCLAVMNTKDRLLNLYNNKEPNDREFWVSEEASASEKEVFINELNKLGYVYDPNDPRIIYKKEKDLPKTWEEFCENNPIIKSNEYFVSTSSDIARGDSFRASQVRNKDIDGNLLPSKQYAEAMFALCKLIQLRDCYNDGWKPDWSNNEGKAVIRGFHNTVQTAISFNYSYILSFKTTDLRDTFLYNFRDLIEKAKILL